MKIFNKKKVIIISLISIILLGTGSFIHYNSISKEEPLIGAYIDGEYSNTLPTKNSGYVVKKIVCDNSNNVTWDEDKWGLKLSNLSGRNKCNIYFETKKPSLTEAITTAMSSNPSMFASDDPDKNIRFIGANPNNYVYFNCSDYANPTADTCELWRIIGVFNNVTKSDGSKENLVKIIRADSLGNFPWDNKEEGVGTSTEEYGSNDWTDSQLMMMLNPTNYLKSGYTNSSDIISSGSQQLYSKMGSYYNGTKGCKPKAVESGASFSCIEVDFTSTGLKNDTTRNAIEEVVWNLGGTDAYNTSTASMFYTAERGTTVYTGRPTIWTGKVGLMYPSDYGYATSGGTTKDRAACLAKELFNWTSWTSSEFSDCKGNDYLYNSSYQWTLAPYSANAYYVFYVDLGGYGNYNAYYTSVVRPALFLKSNIQVDKGTGVKSDPYTLSVN